jgi:hypothetical protein
MAWNRGTKSWYCNTFSHTKINQLHIVRNWEKGLTFCRLKSIRDFERTIPADATKIPHVVPMGKSRVLSSMKMAVKLFSDSSI